MCLFSQCVNKIKTPDKALIITEEQGYVDEEGLGLFFILSEGKKMVLEMLSLIHPW